jgi:hypothetical protein
MSSWALANQGENAPSWVGDFLGIMSWLWGIQSDEYQVFRRNSMEG